MKTKSDTTIAAKPTIIYHYHLKLPTTKTPSNQQRLRNDSLRLAHHEFITDTVTDRRHLQQQANKTKAKAKHADHKVKNVKKNTHKKTNSIKGPTKAN